MEQENSEYCSQNVDGGLPCDAPAENCFEDDIISCNPSMQTTNEHDQRSNNASSVSQILDNVIKRSVDGIETYRQSKLDGQDSDTDRFIGAEYSMSPNDGQINEGFDGLEDDGFCVLPRSQSDNLLELQHQFKTQEAVAGLSDSPTAVSEVVSAGFLQHNQHLGNEYACMEMNGGYEQMNDARLYPESPGLSSQNTGTDDSSFDFRDSPGDERIAGIEEEYIQRIAILEQRHFELEDVLARLTSSLENTLVLQQQQQHPKQDKQRLDDDEVHTDAVIKADDNDEVDGSATCEDVASVQTQTQGLTEKDYKESMLASQTNVQLFMEFQQNIRNFAADLNGVLNCSEAAIRHARVVQEWATSVQIMFEQMKDERTKMLDFIDERERNMLVVREQFIAELQGQGKQLLQIVEEMKASREMREKGENYCRTKMDESAVKKPVEENIIDHLLEKRINEEQSIVLSLSKQSKISELKLFIIHQQSCIQQLQEQNRELKAIIEGLMGPEGLLDDDDLCDTDYSQSGTPSQTGSGTPNLPVPDSPDISTPSQVSTPDRCPIRETLDKQVEPLTLVTDVLHCDRGEYLPGSSTDGDVASIQAYSIGADCEQIDVGEKVVFDPLAVPYVKVQCQLAEESERRAHAADNIEVEDVSDRVRLSPEPLIGETDQDVVILQDGVSAINIEPYLQKCAEEAKIVAEILDSPIEAGDSVDICSKKLSTDDDHPGLKINLGEEPIMENQPSEGCGNEIPMSPVV